MRSFKYVGVDVERSSRSSGGRPPPGTEQVAIKHLRTAHDLEKDAVTVVVGVHRVEHVAHRSTSNQRTSKLKKKNFFSPKMGPLLGQAALCRGLASRHPYRAGQARPGVIAMSRLNRTGRS